MQQLPQTLADFGGRSSLPAWETRPSDTSSSFASLLATLTEPEEKAPPKWNDEGLTEDVATLTYERALRAHARYRPVESDHQLQNAAPGSRPAQKKSVDADRIPKSASITLRMSQAESTQLRERAAEAGLTVSAYLRSCAFDVESLRTQVKEALTQMRSEHRAELNPSTDADQRSGSRWFTKLIPGINRTGNARRP